MFEVEEPTPKPLPRPADLVPFRPCCQAQADEICFGKQSAQAILRAALLCSWSQASGGIESMKCRIHSTYLIQILSLLDQCCLSFCTSECLTGLPELVCEVRSCKSRPRAQECLVPSWGLVVMREACVHEHKTCVQATASSIRQLPQNQKLRFP